MAKSRHHGHYIVLAHPNGTEALIPLRVRDVVGASGRPHGMQLDFINAEDGEGPHVFDNYKKAWRWMMKTIVIHRRARMSFSTLKYRTSYKIVRLDYDLEPELDPAL